MKVTVLVHQQTASIVGTLLEALPMPAGPVTFIPKSYTDLPTGRIPEEALSVEYWNKEIGKGNEGENHLVIVSIPTNYPNYENVPEIGSGTMVLVKDEESPSFRHIDSVVWSNPYEAYNNLMDLSGELLDVYDLTVTITVVYDM